MNETLNQHDLTIVVNTCDAYQDVLDIFFHAFQDCWPDCPYPVVINTESNTHNYPARVNNYRNSTGVDDWGDRLLCTLNSIDTEYVLMLYDDFILDEPVSNQKIAAALNILKLQDNIVVNYLINTDLQLCNTKTDDMFIAIKERADYRLNSAPSIWRRRALLDYTAAGDTPWAWELFGTYRTWGDGNLFYALNPKQVDIYPYNHAKGGAIYRGKWVLEIAEQMAKKYPLNIDWSKRGYSSDTVFEKRSLMWKVRFFQTGFRMVGFKAFFLLTTYIKEKYNAK